MEATIREGLPAIFEYETQWHESHDDGGILRLDIDDLRKAEIGKRWEIEDVDRYPNARRFFNVSYTKVYEDDHGILVIFHTEEDDSSEAIWVTL